MTRTIPGLVAVVLALCLVGNALAGTAQQPPAWWDVVDPVNKRERQDQVTIENTGGAGESEGTYTIFLDNLDDPHKYKEVYMVLQWDTENDTNGSIQVDSNVTIDWPGHGPPEPMVMTVGPGNGPPYHWEYMFTIIPQPPEETVFLEYSGIEVGEKLKLDYDLRTMCFDLPNGDGTIPEPGVLALLAGGLIGLVRQKRR